MYGGSSDISLTEGSVIGINPQFEGLAGDININASESLTLDGNGFEVGIGNGDIQTKIFSKVSGDVIGERSSININTSQLTITNGAVIEGVNDFGAAPGVDININAADIILEQPFLIDDFFLTPGIVAQVFEDGTGNGGDIIITTPRLVVSDGAQVGTTARNNGNGGNLTLNVSDSILLTGTSPSAELDGEGRSGIFVSAETSYEEFITDFDTGEEILTGEIIPTTGNGGNLTLNTGNLTIEKGAFISADTFSLGNGGNANINVNQLILRNGGRISSGSLLGVEGLDTERGSGGNLNITVTESVEITGLGEINGETVNSSLFTLAESNGKAGNTTLTTNNLTVSDGGDINASAIDAGAAGDLTITANSVDLDRGEITAATAVGTGGNVTLDIDGNITLRDESLISAEATGTANGGNVTIDSQSIIAYPSQPDGNDILATAIGGTGGNISITAESLLNIQEREDLPNNGTNDIDATSDSGVDGIVTINNPDVNPLQGTTELSNNVIEGGETVAQACRYNTSIADKPSGLNIKGKGGVPPSATDPLNSSDILLVDEPTTTPNIQAQYPNIKPIKTGIGDIYPARGIIKTEDGQIILTRYPTDNLNTRTPQISAKCNLLKNEG